MGGRAGSVGFGSCSGFGSGRCPVGAGTGAAGGRLGRRLELLEPRQPCAQLLDLTLQRVEPGVR